MLEELLLGPFCNKGREKKKEEEDGLSCNSVLASSYKVLVSFPLGSSPWKFPVKTAREHFHPAMAIIAGLSFGKGAWELVFFLFSHVLVTRSEPSCVGVRARSFIRLYFYFPLLVFQNEELHGGGRNRSNYAVVDNPVLWMPEVGAFPHRFA